MKNLQTLLLGVSGFILLLLIFHSGCKEAEELDVTQLPTLSTFAIQEISSQSASGGGEVTNDGGAPITSRGLVWNTSDNPTTEINEGMTTVDDGVGAFTSSLTNLSPYSTYYVRAYAINSKGANYGNQVEFETLPEGAYSTVTDIDGNDYWTVAIGDYEWMAQNLRTTKYADGTPIINGLSDEEWANTTEGAYKVIPYDDTIKGSRDFNPPLLEFDSYGFLFNSYAADANPCPEGWHVAKDNEWNLMLNFIKLFYNIDDGQVGNAIKSCRQVNSPLGGGCKTDWHPRWDEHPVAYGTNKVFFLGLPAGFVDHTGFYSRLGKEGRYWTLDYGSGWPSRISLSYSNGGVQGGASPPNSGYSIRCIRELVKR
jgi:uncharacterized protein (TIGR02145 family)